jgi:hypothetical protein
MSPTTLMPATPLRRLVSVTDSPVFIAPCYPDLSIKRGTCGDEIASPNGAEHRISRGLSSFGGAPP